MRTQLVGLDDVVDAEVEVPTGRRYGTNEEVVVRVRKRGPRYTIDDAGAAVDLAGRPAGWRDVTERLVAARGLNVNRTGLVFVSAVAGRDLDRLVDLVAETSLSVYSDLMDA